MFLCLCCWPSKTFFHFVFVSIVVHNFMNACVSLRMFLYPFTCPKSIRAVSNSASSDFVQQLKVTSFDNAAYGEMSLSSADVALSSRRSENVFIPSRNALTLNYLSAHVADTVTVCSRRASKSAPNDSPEASLSTF